MLGYDFVNLTPEQIEARRKNLDQAGINGYFLPIALLSTIYLFRSLSKFAIFDQQVSYKTKPNILKIYLRRLDWLLSDTYVPEFGPLQVQVLGTAYIAVLLYLIINGTGNDYMHVTKAFGHVAVSQLPIHYLLSVKHPQSPITLATGLTHERLNSYHRLLGRIIHVLLATHAILYLRFFVAINVLQKRLKDWDVRYGLMAFWTINFLGLLSIPPIRRKLYHKVFYRSHVVLSILLAIVVWLHVPYTRNYVAQAGFFWVSNGILRRGKMAEKASIKCRRLEGGLVEVVATLQEGISWEGWVPGMHGYLNQSGIGPRTPFTVIDAREKEGQAEIVFVVRDLGGPMTGLLGDAAATKKTLTLEVEGPYGEAKEYMAGALQRHSEPTLIVAGGVGATYALPIYQALAEKRKSTSDLKLIWVVKSAEDVKWGLELFRGKAKRNIQICVTQKKGEEKSASALALPGIEFITGRPELREVVKSFFGPPEKNHQPVTVMVCGPGNLSKELKKAMTQHAWHGRKVRWFEEQFGFGGS